MRYPRNAKVFRGHLDMAPWAGMLFLLLMLFIIKTGLFNNPGLMIELPQTDWLTGVEGPTETALLDADGLLYYQSRIVTGDVFVETLNKRRQLLDQDLTLVLHADRDTRWEKVVEVGGMARKAGVTRVLMAARAEFQVEDEGAK